MMLSGFLVALISVCIKQITHIPAAEVLFFSALVGLITNISSLRYRSMFIWGQQRRLLLARGIVGTLGVALYFFTLQNMPLPSAVTLHYTAPIFAAIIGMFMLGEPIHVQQWFFFALSFLGVASIHGFAYTKASWYILSGLSGAFFKGLANSIVCKINRGDSPLIVTFYAYLVTVPLTGAYLLYNFVWPQAQDWLILSSISILGYLAQYLTIKAYQLGPLVPVSATAYMVIIYALLLSYLFFGETLPQVKLLGVGCVLLGTLLNVFYRYKKNT